MLKGDSGFDENHSFLNEGEFDDIYRDESEAAYFEKYERLTKKQLTNRYAESHEDTPQLRKLHKYVVEPHQKLSNEKRQELATMIRSARDERPLQKFFKDNPFVLTSKIEPAHHGQICIPKPNLGGQLHPDFLIAGKDSAGFWWYGVELENPNYHMFTKEGNYTKELSIAMHQIENWRDWLTKNIAYAQDELGYMHIDGDLPCYILIGRRDEEVLDKERLLKRQRSVMKRDKDVLFLHHFEWLLDDNPILVRVK
jgi:hypothetical protein